MRSILSFALLLVTLLASRAFALEIVLGGSVGNVTADQFLAVNNPKVTSTCQPQCSTANSTIQACTTDSCLCDTATVSTITTCEQCMFEALIANDLPMIDPREGSQTALTAYASACLVSLNVTVSTTEITLTLPPDWDGPFGQGLGIPATILTVVAAAALGSGAIFVINTM